MLSPKYLFVLRYLALRLLSIVCCGLLWSCANQIPITGGSKDETPPQLISSYPADQSINYNEGVIQFTFDEYVKTTNLRKELIITPITDVKYEVKTRKNRVTISFDSLLEANTTYSFGFRKGIIDITESNPPENLRLAFSTGPVIDSLFLSGQVVDALTGEPQKEVSVILFGGSDSLTVEGG